MKVTQRIIFRKKDSNWDDTDDVQYEMRSDIDLIDNVVRSSLIESSYSYDIEFNKETQTYVEVRIWNSKKDLNEYKKRIADVEKDVEEKLEQLGWNITEEIE